ncbi:TPA: fibronectin type III domain-containing protein [Listeria monocytogenes]|uniref:fibronectin type III domain-containing protein n=1 Tax=Listeria TaxID=1637 RepID=UPI0002ED7C94|nr:MULTISPECIES: fibronectin type III domain-containing protein [Listeria]EAC4029459.1 fibronectin type III domain-containing protein [Listeria monocytogenes]EAC4052852.1 fibronectin type III domain-containing protein [Listeria monocytogenes]EAC5882008.1 fibronectin type III domain-containing protein [Listeria monocytogenes]EAC5983873.1 fibronectin type III domain-containing protein [Listeria monocytogenes]EAC6770522.1 fibronectin type III domain-containing protein [Listeria monocytogenes]
MRVSTFTDDSITWAWDSVEGASFYRVYLGGALTAEETTDTTFVSTDLSPETVYSAKVSAVSKYNAESEVSEEVSQKTAVIAAE